MKIRAFTLLFVLIIFSVSLSWGAALNEKAPDFTLKDLSGRAVNLKDFEGKVVFIDFWASWCTPCRVELPEISRFISQYKPDEAVVLAISIDKKRSNVAQFLENIPALSKNLHILLDPDSKVVSSYQVRAMPTSFVIDKTGVIRHIHFGYKESDPKLWIEEFNGLLK